MHRRRCFVCEARALEAEQIRENNGSLDGLYLWVDKEEVIDDD